MSCQPNMTERERRMLRAFKPYAFANHKLSPSTCAGCLEAAGFLTMRGYEGDTEYPTCAVNIHTV